RERARTRSRLRRDGSRSSAGAGGAQSPGAPRSLPRCSPAGSGRRRTQRPVGEALRSPGCRRPFASSLTAFAEAARLGNDPHMIDVSTGVPGVNADDPQTFREFWAYYLSQHLHPRTQQVHAGRIEKDATAVRQGLGFAPEAVTIADQTRILQAA